MLFIFWYILMAKTSKKTIEKPTKKTTKKAKVHTTEAMVDEKVSAFVDAWLMKKILNNETMKSILNSDIMESMRRSLKPHFVMLMKILGILAMIFGVLGTIALLGVGGLGALFWGSWSVIFLFSVVLWLMSTLLAVLWWRGMFKMKKWLPFVYTITLFVTIVLLVIDILWWGSANYLSLIVSLIFWFIILKHRDMFVK